MNDNVAPRVYRRRSWIPRRRNVAVIYANPVLNSDAALYNNGAVLIPVGYNNGVAVVNPNVYSGNNGVILTNNGLVANNGLVNNNGVILTNNGLVASNGLVANNGLIANNGLVANNG